jgi:glycosyltransferase involved in cell wall biosynthesis
LDQEIQRAGEMVSIIIPSRQERFLNNTIRDVLANATGEIEIFVILDGYEPVEFVHDVRVKYIRLMPNRTMQKRLGINAAVAKASGEFIMALDAHCMVGKGFDEILAKDCEENWIVIPRRYKLEPESWTIRKDVPPVDYEYWMWREFKKGILKPYQWARPEHQNMLEDSTLTMQGSAWFCHKKYFERMGFMKVDGYTGWGQEDVELALETWSSGGQVRVCKKTFYAHLFKGKTYGRMYRANNSQIRASRSYAFDFWVNKNREKFVKVINQFMPIPNWPINWEKEIYGQV